METHTPLDAYLKRHRITNAQFGEKIGRHASFVSRLRRGASKPDVDLAALIEDATKRQVPMRSWAQSR
jgi:transcriptional regulator with XRE-family HTH domain